MVVDVDDLSGTYVGAGDILGDIEPAGRPLVVYAYLSTEDASGLTPGVPAQVSFGAGIGATYGYTKGVVDSVSRYPVDPANVETIAESSSIVDEVRALGPAKQIVVRLTPASTPSGLAWGHGQGPPGRVPTGLPASVQFVVGSHHPISNVL